MADAGRGRSVKGPRWEIARGTRGYPPVFECLDDPPETLYVVGDPDERPHFHSYRVPFLSARLPRPAGRQRACSRDAPPAEGSR